MEQSEVFKRVGEIGAVVVVRADSVEASLKIVNACVKGGIKGIELTYSVPNAVEAIKQLHAKYQDTDVLIGAGTVVNTTSAFEAIQAGAEFIVSPTFNAEVAELCHSEAVNYVPGCFSPSEVHHAFSAGFSLVKIFPATVLGPTYLKELHGPFPKIKLMPTGGVNADNLPEWFDAGAYVVGAGGSIVGKGIGDLEGIEKRSREFMKSFKVYQESK
ncbi:bifunctional 2-keto-4-hydroxyglutarate aldolase/2-keto-3-deoxy-6-phosphogluconate aldolase [Levilactobacillus fujinensis]|uniref:Bifunctional 2-keto-4-hydroxyglutarate aldolase/2-keto-3-deoxy-6-phosphogluconate aldolase n=1 Tax=Levilactobacillus fujinensis TaxID=2486024 RepID=A0ABW1TIG7_9LACO|nr:bifunctional 2-keto-4-hydroxyglutarate aldolase/2-keto-3-deoxy-6-phosphogluconate aldolase [Levilactobacillus fujinensis]